MVYRCNNLCELKFHGKSKVRGTFSRQQYADGFAFCTPCSVKYTDVDWIMCPCCNARLKRSIRNKSTTIPWISIQI